MLLWNSVRCAWNDSGREGAKKGFTLYAKGISRKGATKADLSLREINCH